MTRRKRRFLRLLLRLYPPSFRARYEDEIVWLLRWSAWNTRKRGLTAVLRFWLRNGLDVLRTALAERRDEKGRARSDTGGQRGDGTISAIAQDLRYAFRQLTKRPGSTATAVITLSIGIGVTTAIFSVVDTLMLRDLPFRKADRIVTLWQNDTKEGVPKAEVAPANFLDWRKRQQAFEIIAAAEPTIFDLISDGPPEVLFAVRITEGFFNILGIEPHVGRVFAPDDFREGRQNVVVLSYGFWQRRFGADPEVIGRALTLDEDSYLVVGVLPREYELGLLPAPGERGVWLPKILEAWETEARGYGFWNVIAKLESGVSVEHARAEMNRVASTLAAEYPTANEGIGVTVVTLREHLVGSARPALLVLLGAAGFVLLIACANVASLLLAQGIEREREFALRAALGAKRHRLVWQLITESMLLGVIGGAAGIALSVWSVAVIKSLSPGEVARMDLVAVDSRVLVFALGMSVITALAFGLLPALRWSNPHMSDVFREIRGTARLSQQRLRNALIVAETAIAVPLLVGAGLLLRSFVAMINVDPGFVKENVVALQVFAWDRGRTSEARAHFFNETLERIERLPVVRSAGAVSAAPFLEADIDIRRSFMILGEPAPRPGEELHVSVSLATPGYFKTLSIPILRGRSFTERDRFDSPPVAVISEAMRRRFFGQTEPVGRMIRIAEFQQPFEIVGVVGDVRHVRLDVAPRPEVFLPQAQIGWGAMTYFVRTSGDPAALLDAIKEQVWTVDPLQAFYRTATVDELVSNTLAARRFSMILLIAFAAASLVMAAIGIYGVISFSISRRTHEVGIRMALGADRTRIVRLVLRQGMVLAGGGVAIGLGIALVLSEALASQLFGIQPRDGATLTGTAVLLLGAAWLACYLPARRATRIDPLEAIRYE